ncbi:MAG: heme-binding domain-containing protein [Bacteroidia bacterium]|nr:heme-binding domain-containing protein [Bacteroidia bacterium]
MKKKIIIVIIFLLAIIQFIKPAKNLGSIYGTNDYTHTVETDQNVKYILDKACMDCHSNKTIYPWYTNIQPFGWWIQLHVNKGKKELNFSEFNKYTPKRQAHKMEELSKEVEEKEMPLNSYTWLHGAAKLNDNEIETLRNWALKNYEIIKVKNNLPPEE